MKVKTLLVVLMLAMTSLSASAQEEEEKNFFNHVSVGLTLGLPGIGLDVAAPVCDYVQLRAGIVFLPHIKVNTDVDVYNGEEIGMDDDEIKLQGKVGFVNGKILADVFPFKHSSFHVTAGAYFGTSSVVSAYNRDRGILLDAANYNERVTDRDDRIGVELGDYLLTPDENGNVKAEIKTWAFKPYLGVGFGRAVPRKRVGCMFELGCQFWGTPSLYCNGEKLTKADIGDDDGGFFKVMSKIKVYPVLNFRICGRIL